VNPLIHTPMGLTLAQYSVVVKARASKEDEILSPGVEKLTRCRDGILITCSDWTKNYSRRGHVCSDLHFNTSWYEGSMSCLFTRILRQYHPMTPQILLIMSHRRCPLSLFLCGKKLICPCKSFRLQNSLPHLLLRLQHSHQHCHLP